MQAVETQNQAPTSSTESVDAQGLTHLLTQLAKPDVQQSLLVLIDNLPRLTAAADKLAQVYETASTLAADPVFVTDIKGGFEEIVLPVADKAKGIASAVMEASDRAQKETDSIGLFGLLKMMNDPQAQKLFRFLRAYLAVANERESAR
ncbi:DUF1641 domain-containing protein [Paenibacillus silviterrae]|uniref:DUF1641 domain-containing protein n=1 Tax=Paenibacillus silviterrae TaxID=3242194 RepID=UPI002543D000|nr:DUF1641 domain-containing protein [Paenibacillus chinjuensis]